MSETGEQRSSEEEGEQDSHSTVERHFVNLRGSPLFVTPREWQLIDAWHQKQIPLRVVKQGLDRSFERPKAAKRFRRLSYCRQSVESSFRRFCEAVAGTRSATDIDEELKRIHAHLQGLEERLLAAERKLSDAHPALASALERSGRALAKLASSSLQGKDYSSIERELSLIEEQLVSQAESALGEEERRRCVGAAERSLEAYRGRMPEDVYRAALRSAYLKRVRGRYGIPALSLFYL